MNTIKRLITSAISVCGYLIVPNWRIPNLSMANRLKRIFNNLEINTVIDVGANEGQYHDFLRNEVGFTGKIESFEPIPELFHVLRERAKGDPSWTVHPCALGSTRGSMQLNVMKGSDFSSFRTPLLSGSEYQRDKNTIDHTIQVDVDTLSNRLGRQEGKRVYLKLDTQGFDIEVMRGCEGVLDSILALQTEVSFVPLYDGAPSYIETIHSFEGRGFSVADFFIVSSDQYNRAVEFDCIMIRTRDISS